MCVFACLLVALITVGRVVAPRLAPPRFSTWTGEGRVDLDEFGMGARATIFAPLRRALARARARLLHVLLAALAGAAAGVGVAFALSWPIAAIAFAGALVAALATIAIMAAVDQARDLRGAVRDAQRAWNDPYATDHETSVS
jgi:hypothetical protein